ncbi:hypothetical protein CEXT_41321 [Caerostris extrusa]|uniref:Uncharacterized protein n=1 Tax=Caerostris extrusa TaxID=172846 RepID=A0AAV4WF33_CAEEX|nr:hypothetical protein CEXT_41321 [Caerostris extrusa]
MECWVLCGRCLSSIGNKFPTAESNGGVSGLPCDCFLLIFVLSAAIIEYDFTPQSTNEVIQRWLFNAAFLKLRTFKEQSHSSTDNGERAMPSFDPSPVRKEKKKDNNA